MTSHPTCCFAGPDEGLLRGTGNMVLRPSLEGKQSSAETVELLAVSGLLGSLEAHVRDPSQGMVEMCPATARL